MSGTSLWEQKNRIALLIQYDGTGFNGWQSQNKGRTVQDEIEKALHIIFKKNIRITASGRTDAGVHALGQVAHFDFPGIMNPGKLCTSLNGILGQEIAVRNVYLVPDTFHARYSATQREYLYLIYNHPRRSPFSLNRAMWVNYKLDIDALRKISSFLTGEKDFASFCKKTSVQENTVRRIDEFLITGKNDLIIFKIRGTAFLHNMVRIIAGTMLDMLKNKTEPDYIIDILEKKDRKASGKTAPAHGLYLSHVTYEPELTEMESAF